MKKLHSTAILLVCMGGLPACGSSSDEREAVRAANETVLAEAAADEALNHADAALGEMDKPGAVAPREPTTLSRKDQVRACKAGIAILMGKSPSIMKASADGDIVHNQYKRPDDGKLWKQDCRIVGNRIHWRGVDSFAGSGTGRWRDGPEDEILTFSFEGNKVRVIEAYPDGSKTEEVYTIKS